MGEKVQDDLVPLVFSMSPFPFVCDSCGFIGLVDRLIEIDGTSEVSINKLNFSKACPRCHSDLRSVDGVYKFVDEIFTFLSDQNTKLEDYIKLSFLFKDAFQNRQSLEKTAEKVAKEVPRARGITSILRKYPDRSISVATLLSGIILMTFQIILALPPKEAAEKQPQIIQQCVSNCFNKNQIESQQNSVNYFLKNEQTKQIEAEK